MAGAYTDPNQGYSEPVPDKSDSEIYQQRARGCLAALIVVSCILLAQAARVCNDIGSCEKEYGYAVSVG